MNNRRAIVLSAVVVVVLGVIVVTTLRRLAPHDTQPIATQAPALEARVADASTAATATAAAEPPPPWALASAVDVVAGEPTTRSENPLRNRQMQDLHQSMQGVLTSASARATETNQHLRKALDTLEEMNDPAVTSQINLDALRDNLEISIKMQAVARQMQDILAEPAGPDRQQRLDTNMAQLRGLQTAMHPDVRAVGSSLPPVSAPAR